MVDKLLIIEMEFARRPANTRWIDHCLPRWELQKLAFNRKPKLRGVAMAVPENRLAKLITLR